MSFLNTTATFKRSSPLPAGTTRQQAISMLHDHEFFLHTDPHMSKFELLSSSTSSGNSLPSHITPLSSTQTTPIYQVTDVLKTLPAGLWDSNVVSTYEFTDTAEGMFVRIKSPLSVVLGTTWTVVGGEGEGKEGGKLELVEDVHIACSRLLMGTVKSACEGGWRAIHGKMIARLEGELRPDLKA